jgi:hypothetical protein
MNQKRKRSYRTFGFAVLIILFGYILNDQLRKIGNEISGEYLQDLVTKESKGLYQLKYETIDLNIFRKTISIRSIDLIATPENREDSINAKNIYEAEVGEINIALKSVLRIYTQKELIVDGIEVVSPLLFMTKINPNQEPLKFGRETGELYDVISQYLELLQINYLKVRSGTVDHSPSNFRLKAIDFEVENFEVSQERNRKKIFYSEAINLGVNQQSISLPDSIHELSFDGFELSTKDSILNFDNFKITPKKGVNVEQVFQRDKQNIYDINIPSLELKGINYLRAYEDNFLVVNEVNIPKPKINIQSVLKSKNQNTEQAENSIGASLLALFDLIKINDFKIEEGGLNLTLKGDNQQRFLSDNITIALFNIELDSTQRDMQNIIHYFEHASVEINEYDYLLPDNLHNIKFKKLNFNTRDSSLLVENLEIKPSRNLDDSTLTQFNLNLPLLKMEGIDHRDIYDNDRIELNSLALRNSQITITPPYLNKEDQQNTMITAEGLSKILGKYFTEIKLDKFSVLNTDVSVGKMLVGKHLNIKSHQLKIDSTLHSWHKIAESTLINGQDLVFNMSKGKFRVSTFQSENNLHSLDLTKLNFTNLDLVRQIEVDYMSLKGVQLDSILNERKIKVDSITLLEPSLNFSYQDIKSNSKEERNWTFTDKPINILLKKGFLNYQLDEFKNLQIASFDVELDYQNEVKLFQVLIEDLRLKDDDLKHTLKLKALRLPKTNSDLILMGFEGTPYQPTDSSSISFLIPEIRFKNFDKNALIQNKRFQADSMRATIHYMKYNNFSDLNKILQRPHQRDNNLSIFIENSRLELKDSNIIFSDDENKKNQLISSGTVLTVNNFNFPKNAQQDLLYADNFNLKNESFNLYSSLQDTVTIRNLNYNSLTKAAEIEEISYAGKDQKNALSIGGCKFKNAIVEDYVQYQQINIEKVSTDQTRLKLHLKKNGKGLPEEIKLPFKSLKIDEFFSKKINIELYHEENERNYYVRNANLKLGKLALDSAIRPKQLHRHINSLAFSGQNYREDFGKHYTITAQNYTFQYPETNFEVHKIKMRSKYDRFEYSKQIDFQNDWFKLDLAALKLKKLNIDSLLISQKFMADKLELEEGEFTVFRDLNVPHNDDKKVLMPQELLSELNFAFSVDTTVVNSDINIHIQPKETSGIGTMTLNIDSGFIFNLRTQHFNNGLPLSLRVNGKFNEVANFSTRVDFPIPSEKNEFHFTGQVGELNLTALNEMLIPLGAIEVRSGFNEEVKIDFIGNDDYAEGIMKFRYNNLKIDILDRETYQSKGFGNNLKTIFANSFVVSSKNPRWFKLQEGNIFFERIKSRSIFNFWAKSLLSGAVSSIGINNSKEDAKAYYKENKEEPQD